MILEVRVEDVIQVGTRLENLEIVSPLGEGGMSRVWLAAVRGLSGETRGYRVVKSLRADLPNPTSFERMLVEEGRLGSHIRHPNVARVHGVGRHCGIPYVVMDFVLGVSLARTRARLTNRGVVLPSAWVAGIGAACARGLHAAHVSTDESGAPLGLVHRDVSPSNLMLALDGRPVVIDFGVAKATATEPHSVVFKGTPRYAPPEQLRGTPIDARADVYGLGAVLYELLAGRRLFSDWSFVQLAERTEPVARLGDSIPEELEELVLQCLESSPERRPPTAAFVAHALERIFDTSDLPSADDLGRLVGGIRKDAPTAYFRALGLAAASRPDREARFTPSHVRLTEWEPRSAKSERGDTDGDITASEPSMAEGRGASGRSSEAPAPLPPLEGAPTVVQTSLLGRSSPRPPTRPEQRVFEVDDELPTRPHVFVPLNDSWRESNPWDDVEDAHTAIEIDVHVERLLEEAALASVVGLSAPPSSRGPVPEAPPPARSPTPPPPSGRAMTESASTAQSPTPSPGQRSGESAVDTLRIAAVSPPRSRPRWGEILGWSVAAFLVVGSIVWFVYVD